MHPRFHTPAVALMGQAIIAGLFALTGGYESPYTKAIFSRIPLLRPLHGCGFCAAAAGARAAAPLSDLGLSPRPTVFVILAACLLVNTFWQQRVDSLWGVNSCDEARVSGRYGVSLPAELAAEGHQLPIITAKGA